MEYDVEITKFGTTIYYKKGTTICHKEDDPAINYINGDKMWVFNGLFHRVDGPAIIYASGRCSWYINGNRLSLEKEIILNKWWKNKNGI